MYSGIYCWNGNPAGESNRLCSINLPANFTKVNTTAVNSSLSWGSSFYVSYDRSIAYFTAYQFPAWIISIYSFNGTHTRLVGGIASFNFFFFM